MDALSISLALLQEPNFVRNSGDVFGRLVLLLAGGLLAVVLAAVLAVFLILRFRKSTGHRRFLWMLGWSIAVGLTLWLAWFAALFIR